ncbi:hypothetical protein C8R43DRAFT_1117841 [Mycena crocata]|nr:hypothetical protein C8R43DRAFT_1117841 [Mycena crocata]
MPANAIVASESSPAFDSSVVRGRCGGASPARSPTAYSRPDLYPWHSRRNGDLCHVQSLRSFVHHLHSAHPRFTHPEPPRNKRNVLLCSSPPRLLAVSTASRAFHVPSSSDVNSSPPVSSVLPTTHPMFRFRSISGDGKALQSSREPLHSLHVAPRRHRTNARNATQRLNAAPVATPNEWTRLLLPDRTSDCVCRCEEQRERIECGAQTQAGAALCSSRIGCCVVRSIPVMCVGPPNRSPRSRSTTRYTGHGTRAMGTSSFDSLSEGVSAPSSSSTSATPLFPGLRTTNAAQRPPPRVFRNSPSLWRLGTTREPDPFADAAFAMDFVSQPNLNAAACPGSTPLEGVFDLTGLSQGARRSRKTQWEDGDSEIWLRVLTSLFLFPTPIVLRLSPPLSEHARNLQTRSVTPASPETNTRSAWSASSQVTGQCNSGPALAT